jgi:hypothetical protein
MGDYDEIDDLNDNGALALEGPSSASEEWNRNPDAVAIPMLYYSTKEMLVAVDECQRSRYRLPMVPS